MSDLYRTIVEILGYLLNLCLSLATKTSGIIDS